MTIDGVNADQFCSVYEHCRTEALARCVADRAPDFDACADVTDVNRLAGRVVPHLLELHRRSRQGNP